MELAKEVCVGGSAGFSDRRCGPKTDSEAKHIIRVGEIHLTTHLSWVVLKWPEAWALIQLLHEYLEIRLQSANSTRKQENRSKKREPKNN